MPVGLPQPRHPSVAAERSPQGDDQAAEDERSRILDPPFRPQFAELRLGNLHVELVADAVRPGLRIFEGSTSSGVNGTG